MTEYTIDDLNKDYKDNYDKHCFKDDILLSGNLKESFIFNKLIELTNRVQELESKTIIIPSHTKEQLNEKDMESIAKELYPLYLREQKRRGRMVNNG